MRAGVVVVVLLIPVVAIISPSWAAGATPSPTTVLNGSGPGTAAAAPKATGKLTVTPSTNLVDGQTVTVVGSGFAAHVPIVTNQCAGGDDAPFCENDLGAEFGGGGETVVSSSSLETDSSGRFTTTMVVGRYVTDNTGPVDCAQPQTVCTVSAASLAGGPVTAVSHRITFDPTKPALPAYFVNLALPTSTFAVQSDGSVLVTGTVTCSAAGKVTVDVVLGQAIGRSAVGSATTQAECTTTATTWTTSVVPGNGSFADGTAVLSVVATHGYPVASNSAVGAVTLTGVVPSSRYYVAVGDSLVTGFAAPPGQGYVDNLAKFLRPQLPGLGVANFGCSSETTDTMIHGGICSYASGSQLGDTEAFLRANRGKVAMLTIDIGGNDVVFCENSSPAAQAACFVKALAHMDANVRSIMAGLRAAAGPGVPFVAMNYFDPLLYLWFTGAAGQATAEGTVSVLKILNQHLAADFAAYGAPVADVAGAFHSTDTTLVDTQWGRIPENVNRACEWLDIGCGPGHAGFGDDANAAGYRVIAQQFEKVMVLPATWRAFVQAAAADFLGAPPSAATLAADTSDLSDGTVSRRAYLAKLSRSTAWLDATVNAQYQAILGRPGDPNGVAFWAGRLASGKASVAQMTASLWASDEALATVGQGSVSTWVTQLYGHLLGRAPDPSGLAYWTAQAASAGRGSVAYRLVQSPESARSRVTGLFQQLLGRAPDASGLAFWSTQVVARGDLALAVSLATSHEYLVRATARFPAS